MPARASRYSSSLASGSMKFASNGVFVYAGSMTETRTPLVRSSWFERFRIAFHCVLGGGIERAIRHRQKAKHGADVDDPAASLAPHVGHDGARHPDKPEEVRFEDRPGLIERALFGSRRGNTQTGVVYQPANTAIAP